LGIVETFLSLGDAITELLDIPACEYGAWDVQIQLLFFSQGVYKNKHLHSFLVWYVGTHGWGIVLQNLPILL